MKPPYTDWERVITWPYGTDMYDIDVSPDGTLVSARSARSAASRTCGCSRRPQCPRAIPRRSRASTSARRCRTDSCSRPTDATCSAAPTYTGVSNIFRYDLAVEEGRCRHQHRYRVLPAGTARPTAGCSCSATPGGASCRPGSTRSRSRTSAPSRSSASGSSRNVRCSRPGCWTRLPRYRSTRWRNGRASITSPAACDANRSTPIVQGYKDTAAVGMRVQLLRPAAAQSASVLRRMVARRRSRRPANAPASFGRVRAVRLARQRGVQPRRFLRSLRPDEDRTQGVSSRAGGTQTTLIFDEPRRLELDVSGSISGNLDRLPGLSERAGRRRHAGDGRGRADVLRRQQVARLCRRRERSQLVRSTSAPTSWTAISFPRLEGTFDRGVGLPIGHSSIWMRTAGGFSPRDRALPFANFFFGGFGNNYVDQR